MAGIKVGDFLRRIVPPGYATGMVEFVGTSPLLMNSAEADRDSELYRTFYMLGQKKRKTLDDEARLRELEWQLRIYLDEKIGPYVPGRMVKEVLRRSATKWSKGEDIKRSLVVIEYRVPLVYDGPRDQQALWDAGYRFTTMVANNGFNAGRVLRCRPMFPDWTVKAEIAWDPEDLDTDLLAAVVDRSQKYGLGDYRPEFGSFKATLFDGDMHKIGAKGDATKARNGVGEKNHDAFKARIMVGATK
jgi:hypothetical protein